jgi:hypothetical protein
MDKTETAETATRTAPEKTVQLPSFQTYGNYSSDNYGAHALQFFVGDLVIWFSYKTPIAFKKIGGERVVRQNDWKQTTGKHLNAIDGGDKKSRVDGATFERLFAEALS